MFRMKVLTMLCCLVLSPAALAHGQSCPYGESPPANCLYPRVISGSAGHHVVLMDVHGSIQLVL